MTFSRVALVTGAASGIGASICRKLAAPGVGILLHTRRNEAGAARVVSDIAALGGRAEIFLGDLAERATAGAAVARAVEMFGGLDVLVSNAGFADRTPVSALSDDAAMASHEAIAGAFLRLARAAAPHLSKPREPRIVAVSSFVAHVFRTDLATFPASAAAKAAVEALVRALSVELAPSGTTVNAVVPGFIRKDDGAHAALDPASFAQAVARIPLGRLGMPEDVAAAVAFLVSREAGYITGQALHVSGGLVV